MVRCEQDVYAWSLATAAALRERRLEDVDLDAVAEEVLDVGKQERSKLRTVLMQVMVHMLKWRFQPGRRTRSWDLSMVEHRERARLILKDNPSLGPLLSEVIGEAYGIARVRAARQTGIELSLFPQECIFSVDEVLGL